MKKEFALPVSKEQRQSLGYISGLADETDMQSLVKIIADSRNESEVRQAVRALIDYSDSVLES